MRQAKNLYAKKTKVMHIEVQINGQKWLYKLLEIVKEFKYLGSIKTHNCSCTEDFRTRIAMANKRIIQLNNLWKNESIPTKCPSDGMLGIANNTIWISGLDIEKKLMPKI